MNRTIAQLLNGKADNHMLPFFWQHGEDEETLRKYMEVIHRANCYAVCVESRPPSRFLRPKVVAGYGYYSGRGPQAEYEGLDLG